MQSQGSIASCECAFEYINDDYEGKFKMIRVKEVHEQKLNGEG